MHHAGEIGSALQVFAFHRTGPLDVLHKKLSHPNIVTVRAQLRDDKVVGLATDYLEDESLRAYLKKHGPLKELEIRKLALGGAQALQYLHGSGYAHRDIKPSSMANTSISVHAVLIRARCVDFLIKKVRKGLKFVYVLVLIDFGLAFDKDKGSPNRVCGTRGYAAPELFFGLVVTTQALDIFSLGVVLMEMHTNEYKEDGYLWNDGVEGDTSQSREVPGVF